MSQNRIIQPDMTVLDIVSRFRSTEKIFKHWDEKAGECICCNSLFDDLDTLAEKYGLPLADLLSQLEWEAKKG